MTLENATAAMNQTAEKMAAMYGAPVFDEMAIVAINTRGGKIFSYSGGRRREFQRNFSSDVEAIRSQLLHPDHHLGDFHFARDAAGTAFDAFIVAGDGVFIIFNNVSQAMEAVAKNPRWLRAQVPFVELADKFRHDPLVCDW